MKTSKQLAAAIISEHLGNALATNKTTLATVEEPVKNQSQHINLITTHWQSPKRL